MNAGSIAFCTDTMDGGRLAVNEEAQMAVEDEDDVEHSQSIWDAKKLGRIIYGARIRAGYDRMSDLALDLNRVTGVRRHENTLYDIQNGKRLPDMELMTALQLHLGMTFREVCEALAPEYRDRWIQLHER